MDAHEVKDKVGIADVLIEYGWSGRTYGSGDYRKTECPFHPDTSPSASVNLVDGRFQCFAGCTEGTVDIFDIVQEQESTNFAGAMQHLKQVFRLE